MSEITNKEKMLKNVRKALLVPSNAPFVSLDLDSEIYNSGKLTGSATLAKSFVNYPNHFFQACSSKHDFLNQLQRLVEEKSFRSLSCFDSFLSELLANNGIKSNLSEPDEHSPFITTCVELITRPVLLSFDLRTHDLRKILSAPHLIVVAKEQQIKNYIQDKRFFHFSPMETNSKTMVNPNRLMDKSVYLFTVHDDW